MLNLQRREALVSFQIISCVADLCCFGQRFVNETPGQLETEEKAWLEDWDSDIEFGRQTLNGMNPGCIQRWAQVLDFGG